MNQYLAIIFIAFMSSANTSFAENPDESADAKYTPLTNNQFVEESCEKLSTDFGSNSKLSSLQKKKGWKDYQR